MSSIAKEDRVSYPNCPDQGGWVDYEPFSGEPVQVQCEFCWTEPNSVFYIKEGLDEQMSSL